VTSDGMLGHHARDPAKKCYRAFFNDFLASFERDDIGEAIGGADAKDTAVEPSMQKEILWMPAPPRWRFINEAKKTLGYSTLAAGRFVKGLSAEELLGMGNSPQSQLTNKDVTMENTETPASEIDEELQGRKDKLNNTVGRLHIKEQEVEVDEMFEGVFARFRRRSRSAEEENKGEPKEAQSCSSVSSLSWSVALGNILQATPKVDELDQIEKQVKVVREQVVARKESLAPTPPASSCSSNGQSFDEMELHQPSKTIHKKWRTMILPALVLVSVAIVGAVLRNNTRARVEHSDSGDNNEAIHAIVQESNAPLVDHEEEREHDCHGIFSIWVGPDVQETYSTNGPTPAPIPIPDYGRKREHERHGIFSIWVGHSPTSAPSLKHE